MATDTLEIFGTEYTGVTGIKATDNQSGTKVYIRPQGTKSISANGTGIDVAEYASVNVNVAGAEYTRTVIAPQQTVTPTSAMQQMTLTSTGLIEDAKSYIVTIDNVEWFTTCETLWSENYCIGDVRYFLEASPSNTIYPFGAICENGVVYACFATTGSHTIKIERLDFVTGGTTLTTKNITANGTYNASSDSADGYSSVVVNVSGGGGGGEPAPKKKINFIDYDGTIVDSYTATEWQSVTALPSNPSHTGLTAQGWNWTKAQIDAQLTAAHDGDVWVGQMYITTSGDTEIDVELQDGRLSPYLSCAVDGTITIDWGDNSTSTVTGTSLTTRKDTQHIYASAGDYTITIHVESGSWSFYGSNTYTLLNKANSTGNANRVYSNCVQNVRVGDDTSIGEYAFAQCMSVKSITIPREVVSIGNNAFSNCYSLESITIPSDVTSIGNYAFYSCNAISKIAMPSGITSIGTYVFYYCYSITSIMIPSGVTSIGSNAFQNCYSLANITVPSGITSIAASTFSGCYGVAEYHIKPTVPPTLASSNAFSNIQSECVIYVPSASLETYKTASSNWKTYASKMQGE